MIDELIRGADPVDRDDPTLDPDGPRARAVLAAATAAHNGSPAPRRRVRRRLAVALAVVAAAATGAALVPAGPSPHAAMLQAAERTAAYTSGRVVTIGEIAREGYEGRFRTELRFEPERLATSHDFNGQRLEYRNVDGKMYDRRGDEPWRETGTGPMSPEWPGDMQRQMAGGGLVEVLERSHGATREGDTVRATVSAGDLEDVPLPTAILPVAAVEPDRRYAVTVELGEDDVLRSLDLRHEDGGVLSHWRLEFHDLGEPQNIEAPI